MSASPLTGRGAGSELTIKNDDSEASLTLTAYADGSYEFTDETISFKYGSAAVGPREFLKKLYDAISALS